MTQDDLGDYYRRFITCSAYLLEHDCLSQHELSIYYLRGFPRLIRTRILQRLQIKEPNVRPSNGYKFDVIHEAALFVLSLSDNKLENEFLGRERYHREESRSCYGSGGHQDSHSRERRSSRNRHNFRELSGPLYPNAPNVLFCAFPRPASPTSNTYPVGCPSPT